MAVTEVSICNSALIKVGTDRIGALSDDNKRARACNEMYEKTRDLVLYEHPWNFAIARAELAQDVTSPEFGYAYQYSLPSLALRVLETNLTDFSDWVIEGRKLLTDEGSVKIKYIKKITDTTLFPPSFAEVLAVRLAVELSYHLVQSNTLGEKLYSLYDRLIRKARSFDAQEGQVKQVEAIEWHDARF